MLFPDDPVPLGSTPRHMNSHMTYGERKLNSYRTKPPEPALSVCGSRQTNNPRGKPYRLTCPARSPPRAAPPPVPTAVPAVSCPGCEDSSSAPTFEPWSRLINAVMRRAQPQTAIMM